MLAYARLVVPPLDSSGLALAEANAEGSPRAALPPIPPLLTRDPPAPCFPALPVQMGLRDDRQPARGAVGRGGQRGQQAVGRGRLRPSRLWGGRFALGGGLGHCRRSIEEGSAGS